MTQNKKQAEVFFFILAMIVLVWAVAAGSTYLSISNTESRLEEQDSILRKTTSKYAPDAKYCRKDFRLIDCVSVWRIEDSDARLIMKRDNGKGYIIFTQKLEGNFISAYVSLSAENHWAEYLTDKNGKVTALTLDGTRFYLE